jgi:hypothetical protein
MEEPLHQTKAVVSTTISGKRVTTTFVKLFATHLELNVPVDDIQKFFIEKIVNIYTYAKGFSFVYDGRPASFNIVPAPDAVDPKMLQSWVPLINFYKRRKNILDLHPHALTAVNEQIEGMKCHKCKWDIRTPRHFVCEYCDNFILCNTCHTSHINLFNTRRESKYHSHMLHKYTTLSQCISADMCGICNESIEKYYLSNVCYDCMKYAEHEVCAQEQLRDDTATLNIDTLNHVLKYDESTREYALSLNDGAICPKEMSVLTRGFVDLTELFDKPLDDAYFEVTFLAFKSEEKVGIIVDSERESQPLLFGPDATAFMNDGKVYYASLRHSISSFVPICPGDTVGMGMLLDSYNQTRLFLTHNGVVHKSTLLLTKDKKYSPGVCFTKNSAVRFKFQARGPFVFDLSRIPNHRNVRLNYLEQVPREIPLLLLSWLVDKPVDVIRLRQVCKTWLKYSNDNFIWKAMFLKRWPGQNPNLPVASWKRFYRARLDQSQSSSNNFLHPIENCAKHDDCPLFWQNLPQGQTKNERYCNKCDRTVYSVHKRQFEEYKADGRRVCLIPQKSVGFNRVVTVVGEQQARDLHEPK